MALYAETAACAIVCRHYFGLAVAFALASWCFNLPPAAANQMFDFVFHPASYVHPDRLKLHLPAELVGCGVSNALVSQALQSSLGLGDDVALNLQDKTHRAALLPAPALATLALRLGLHQQSHRMKLVILRSELTLLQKHLTPLDWDFVFALQPAKALADAPLLGTAPMADWPALLAQLGWRTLESACGGLPQSVGKRLLLKLPVVAQSQSLSAEHASALVHDIYPALVNQWNPHWDADWLAPTSKNQ